MKVFQKALLVSVLSLGVSYPLLANEGVREGGIYHASYNLAEPVRLTLQEFLTTTVVLPSDEKITVISNGDRDNFQDLQTSDHVFLIKPKGVMGSESSIVVHGSSGRVYTFYVRSEKFNSKTIPDLKVVVHAAGEPSRIRDLKEANTEKQASSSTNIREDVRNLHVTVQELLKEQKKFHRDYLLINSVRLPEPHIEMAGKRDKLLSESLAELEDFSSQENKLLTKQEDRNGK